MAKAGLEKTFIGVSIEVSQRSILALNTTIGRRLVDTNGIDLRSALDFLFGLRHLNKIHKGHVFISYAFSRDVEVLFNTLPSDVKDRLFESHTVRASRAKLEYEQEDILYDLWHVDKDTQEYEQLDFDKYVNQLALAELSEVKYDRYTIIYHTGKSLTIRANKQAVTIYDAFGFFRKPLFTVAQRWLNENVPLLKSIPARADISQRIQLSTLRLSYLVRVMDKLDQSLKAHNINLRRYDGVGSISAHILNRTRARTGDKDAVQYHSYRARKTLSPELDEAVKQAYYGGRVEQLKIGTFNQPVYLHDVNSAYANAISYLPLMRQKMRYVTAWKPAPFSLWYCDYDFTSLNPYIGYLPYRSLSSGLTSYRLAGRGFLWQPEVSFVLQHFPGCISIRDGFVLPYERADFARDIELLYELRQELQKKKHPLEKIIKLALSGIYGKFKAERKSNRYYNLFYSGFITSFARRQLLDAVIGNEHNVICFLTDAIHATEKLDVPVSDKLGEFKVEVYKSGLYIDSGIYQLRKVGGGAKVATRGFRSFDFNLALNELNSVGSYRAIMNYFIGHNLKMLAPTRYQKYLDVQRDLVSVAPSESNIRFFRGKVEDFKKGFLDSIPVDLDSGLDAAPFQDKHSRYNDMITDAMIAHNA